MVTAPGVEIEGAADMGALLGERFQKAVRRRA